MQKALKKSKPEKLSECLPRIFTRPGYLLLLIVSIIFISESLVMLALDRLPTLAPYQEMILDAMLLSIVTFPLLRILVFKPLRLHIQYRHQAEQQKDELIEQLQQALDEVKTLQGILPICSSCKRIRDDNGFWQKVESYIQSHSNVEFSHGLCNDCIRENYPDDAEQIIKRLDSD
jgi:hypothetical protein